jgi:hypothetical protein
MVQTQYKVDITDTIGMYLWRGECLAPLPASPEEVIALVVKAIAHGDITVDLKRPLELPSDLSHPNRVHLHNVSRRRKHGEHRPVSEAHRG